MLLPYLSSISRKCTQLSTWFPDQALKELQKRVKRPPVYVSIIELSLTTPSFLTLFGILGELDPPVTTNHGK